MTLSSPETRSPEGAHLNTIVQLCLNGESVSTPSQAAAMVIDLLASDYEIERETRDMLADAMRRGLFGNREVATLCDGTPLPRLVLEGMGRAGRLAESILARRKWLEAADELHRLRESGVRGYAALAAAGEKFGLGIDSVRKAQKFQNKLVAALRSETDPLKREAAEALGVANFDIDQEGHADMACSIFIEREAEASTA